MTFDYVVDEKRREELEQKLKEWPVHRCFKGVNARNSTEIVSWEYWGKEDLFLEGQVYGSSLEETTQLPEFEVGVRHPAGAIHDYELETKSNGVVNMYITVCRSVKSMTQETRFIVPLSTKRVCIYVIGEINEEANELARRETMNGVKK